jgi:hypothetical protein
MQKAAKVFLRKLPRGRSGDVEAAARAALNFWVAVAQLVPQAFAQHRSYLVTKGIGVYALMELAAEVISEVSADARLDSDFFATSLADFMPAFDWSNTGPLKGLGGEGGVPTAVRIIGEARRRARFRIAHG